jgi:ribosomal-protein-alanine N-acetyltransferase
MRNFTPFPILLTPRLLLRPLMEKDAPDLFALRKDPEHHAFTDTRPDGALRETLAYIRSMNQGVADNRWLIWAMELKETHTVIGTISLWNFAEALNSAELGFGLQRAWQGQGFMKEALYAVADYGFTQLQLSFLDAYTEENNLPSRHLLESTGFTLAGALLEKGMMKAQDFSMLIYRKTPRKT